MLDLGCCMGTDLRQFVLDGWCTAGDAVGLDSQPSFIDAGLRMFGDEVSNPILAPVSPSDMTPPLKPSLLPGGLK